MSGGGVLLPYQQAHQYVLRLRNPSVGDYPSLTVGDIIVPLERQLENLQEIWLTEYMVDNDQTPAANNMWRIDISPDGFECEQTSNAKGRGHCILIADMTNPYHHSYDTPRVMSLCNKKGVSSFRVRIVDEFGALVSFTSVTLMLTFVTLRQGWSPQDAKIAQDNLIEWWRSNENNSRFRVNGRFV